MTGTYCGYGVEGEVVDQVSRDEQNGEVKVEDEEVVEFVVDMGQDVGDREVVRQNLGRPEFISTAFIRVILLYCFAHQRMRGTQTI